MCSFLNQQTTKLVWTSKQPRCWDAAFYMPASIWNRFFHSHLLSSSAGENHRIHTMRAIKVSYLVLVDEEKHDGQNLQEEDDQEQEEELWRHKGKRKGQLSDLIHHLSGRRKRPQGDNRHLSVESVWSINWGEWKRPPTPDCGGIKYKERNNHRLSRRKSCWRSKGDRRAVDCSASLFLPDGSTEQRELRKSDSQSRWDTIGEMIYSFPLYTFEFVERATFLFLASPHPPLLSMATGMSCWMGDASCCGPRWRLKTIKSSSSSLHQELKPKFFVHICLLFFFFFCKLEQVKVWWSSI